MGKSRLLHELQQRSQAAIAYISFGITEKIETPLSVMGQLYQALPPTPSGWQEAFSHWYSAYEQAIDSLQKQPVDGKSPIDYEAVQAVVNSGVRIGQSALSIAAAKPVEAVGKAGEAIGGMVTIVQKVQQLLEQHPATRRRPELQKLNFIGN